MVRYGRTLPDGYLPVYSVGTEEEAQKLLVLACPTNLKGEYVAVELAEEQTLGNLRVFGDRLDQVHKLIVQRGDCRCQKGGSL